MRFRLLPALVCLAVTVAAQETWKRDQEGKSRSLTYSGTATLMGKQTPVTLRFYCNPERTKNATGVIGYDLAIAHPDSLKPFDFDDFEGPDAPSYRRKLLQASVLRGGKTVHSMRESPSGSYVPGDAFMFEVTDVFDEPGSSAKKTLRALAKDADAFRITITDYKKADLKLEVTVPIKGKRSDFEWLLAGLR